MAATERIPNLLEDDLLDAEVGEFLQNYLQLSGEVCRPSIDQKYSNYSSIINDLSILEIHWSCQVIFSPQVWVEAMHYDFDDFCKLITLAD